MNYESFKFLPPAHINNLWVLLTLKNQYRLEFTKEEKTLIEYFDRYSKESTNTNVEAQTKKFLENCSNI
jgi:hypothetical protein